MINRCSHSDHLGSASYITDSNGYETQQLVYLPFGEDWVDLKYNTSQYDTPYKFNGKEKDEETGYHYYGARYYWGEGSIWLSVDPMSDKYPHLTSYNYCANNPVMLIDPDGREIGETFSKLTGEKIHDDGIKDGKVYVGTKSDGSDREYVGQKSNMKDMTSVFNKQLQETKFFFEQKNEEFSARESKTWGGMANKLSDRLSYFRSQVTDKGPFDLKNKNYGPDDVGNYSFFEGKLFRYDDYGNYNYGVAAKAFGLSETMALFGAGANQTKKALSPTGIMFIPLGFMPVFGKINLMSPSNVKGFFDDPRDTHMIKKGYSR